MRVTFLYEWYGDHRDLHVLTHSFPTRSSSDLGVVLCRTRPPLTRDIWMFHGSTPSPAAQAFIETTSRLRDEGGMGNRSEEHTSELQSLMRNSYAVLCLKQK